MADNSLSSGGSGDTIRTVAKTANNPAKTQMNIIDVGGGADGSAETAWTGAVQVQDGSGNAINSLAAGTGQNGLMVAMGATNFFYSTVNASSTQLGAGATFTGTVETALSEPAVSIIMSGDQQITLTILQYEDAAGLLLVDTWTYVVAANAGLNISRVLNGNYVKFTATNNGGSTTTTFNLNVAYGNILPATMLGNNPTAINEVGNVAIPTGGSIPTQITNTPTITDPATLNATTSDQPLFTAITGDPNGDFAGVNLLESLMDPSTNLSMQVNVVNQPTRDANGSLIISDAPYPIKLSGIVGQQFTIDTIGYQSLQMNFVTMAANLTGSNDGLTWNAVSGSSSIYGAGVTSAPTVGAALSIPCVCRWLRITVTTAGAASGFLRTVAWLPGYSQNQPMTLNQIGNVALVGEGTATTNSPVTVGGIARTAVLSLSASQASRATFSTGGALVTFPYAVPDVSWQFTQNLAVTTSTAAQAAGAAGVRNYVTDICFVNTVATAQTVTILDGATVIWTGTLPSTIGGSIVQQFNKPLRGTAATALNVQLTAATSTNINIGGFQAP